MQKWTKIDNMLLTTILQTKESALMKSMKNYLLKHYSENEVIATKDFILCQGKSPIMIVCHMDTVFKTPPTRIFYDQKQEVMWSPEGLGADDRAGVFLVWKLVQAGLRPHLCLTTGEEWGGIGAEALINYLPTCPYNIKYIVELDRQGTNDCVFYNCANDEFESFIENYGFVTDFGTFTDISVICPKWGIAGVNLSVGYFHEHTFQEILHVKALLDTYKKVYKMIEESEKAPFFKYIPDPLENFYKNFGNKFFKDRTHLCNKCGHVFTEDDLFPILGKDCSKFYLCYDCIDNSINWCENCGEPYERVGKSRYCPKCLKENKI